MLSALLCVVYANSVCWGKAVLLKAMRPASLSPDMHMHNTHCNHTCCTCLTNTTTPSFQPLAECQTGPAVTYSPYRATSLPQALEKHNTTHFFQPATPVLPTQPHYNSLHPPSYLDDWLLPRLARIREGCNEGAVEHLLQHALSHLTRSKVANVQLEVVVGCVYVCVCRRSQAGSSSRSTGSQAVYQTVKQSVKECIMGVVAQAPA